MNTVFQLYGPHGRNFLPVYLHSHMRIRRVEGKAHLAVLYQIPFKLGEIYEGLFAPCNAYGSFCGAVIIYDPHLVLPFGYLHEHIVLNRAYLFPYINYSALKIFPAREPDIAYAALYGYSIKIVIDTADLQGISLHNVLQRGQFGIFYYDGIVAYPVIHVCGGEYALIYAEVIIGDSAVGKAVYELHGFNVARMKGSSNIGHVSDSYLLLHHRIACLPEIHRFIGELKFVFLTCVYMGELDISRVGVYPDDNSPYRALQALLRRHNILAYRILGHSLLPAP